MPGPHSGQYGVLENVVGVRDWSITEETTPEEVRNSTTKGGMMRLDGISSSNGSYNAESGKPYKMPGEFITDFRGYTAPDDDVFGNDGEIVKVTIYISSVTINLNWAGSESVNHSVDFQGTTPLVFEKGFFEDTGPLDIGSICDVKIEYSDDGTVWTLLEHISTATLTFTREQIAYINSSTNCVEAYKPGPLDWTLDMTIEDNVRPIPLRSDKRWRVWINDTEFYRLDFGHLVSYSDLNVNMSTGEIISQAMNVVMQSIRQSDGEVGQILLPDTSTYWPEAVVPPAAAITAKKREESPLPTKA